jgi:glutathione peroxidase
LLTQPLKVCHTVYMEHQDISQIAVLDAQGNERPFALYMGTATLVVNVASRCGFTSQYEGLEQLHRTYAPQGLRVVGFPCNQFGGQEPGSNEDIQTFCSLTYQVTFPVLSKTDVNGPQASPLYVWLKKKAPGLLGLEAIKWNFTKFLLDATGSNVERFAPNVLPVDMKPAIERMLKMPTV